MRAVPNRKHPKYLIHQRAALFPFWKGRNLLYGLYLHIPYCSSKCRYCDFYSIGKSSGVPDAYIEALLREIKHFADVLSVDILRPSTVYFGGGTPSLLSPAQTERLLSAVEILPEAEITLECNPEHAELSHLQGFRAAGVNRISFGVQTAFDESLARLGRHHTAEQARRALATARKAGFCNISGDVMLALPDYSSEELDATLSLLAEGGCTHISSYLLKIEPNTVFGKRPPENLPDEDASADFYLSCVERLAALGYRQYEISNFAKPGYEGRHNLLYWNCRDYIGVGVSAAGCLSGKRFSTPPGLQSFLNEKAEYVEEGACTAEDFIMLQLRLVSGLSLSALQRDWGVTWDARRLAFCKKLAQQGLAVFDGEVLRLTPQGFLVQNSILCELL